MFKLVVLCAFIAAASAEPKPDHLISSAYQYSTYLSPGSTTITKQDSSVIHPSPLFYQAPLAYTHFIKKRSPQFPLTYAASEAYYPNYNYANINYNTPLLYNTPLITSSPLLHSAAPAVHLIKKRSAPLFPTTYYSPATTTYTSSTPFLTSTYTSSSPFYSHAPLISQPLAYTHLIKKRSAGLLGAYIAPTSYSHQSRFDLKTTHTPYSSISYASPLTYSSPLAWSRLY